MAVDVMKLPEGVFLSSEEWASIWPVAIKQFSGEGFTVCYSDGKGTIHRTSEVIIEYQPGRRLEAEKLARLLRLNGWCNLRLEMQSDPFIDLGGES